MKVYLEDTETSITKKIKKKKKHFENVNENVCMHAQSIQSYLSLCDPMDCSLPGSSIHGIF